MKTLADLSISELRKTLRANLHVVGPHAASTRAVRAALEKKLAEARRKRKAEGRWPMSALPQEPLARLLTSREAASLLAVSPRKLWELTNCSAIPHIRIGRSVRYCPRDLAAWIGEQKIEAKR